MPNSHLSPCYSSVSCCFPTPQPPYHHFCAIQPASSSPIGQQRSTNHRRRNNNNNNNNNNVSSTRKHPPLCATPISPSLIRPWFDPLGIASNYRVPLHFKFPPSHFPSLFLLPLLLSHYLPPHRLAPHTYLSSPHNRWPQSALAPRNPPKRPLAAALVVQVHLVNLPNPCSDSLQSPCSVNPPNPCSDSLGCIHVCLFWKKRTPNGLNQLDGETD